jgi:thiamine biosynthesis lipoprotein
VRLDLGAIGKGYAVERMVEVLRGHGIASALVYSGTSTIYALGSPPGEDGWAVGIAHPRTMVDGQWLMAQGVQETAPCALTINHQPSTTPRGVRRVATLRLRDRALSTSTPFGKCFEADGRTYGHVFDPRTGQPAEGVWSASAICPSPTDADALSTAFLVLRPEETQRYCEIHRGHAAVLMLSPEDGREPSVVAYGLNAVSPAPQLPSAENGTRNTQYVSHIPRHPPALNHVS